MLLFLEKLSTTIANLTSIAARLMLASVAVVLFVQVVQLFAPLARRSIALSDDLGRHAGRQPTCSR